MEKIEKFDLAIIGGSISGLALAYFLKDTDLKIAVLEEDKEIGHPLRCSGIVSKRIFKFFPKMPKSIVEKNLKKAKIFCREKEIELKVNAYILNRPKLEEWLYKQLKKRNVKFIFEKAINFFEKQDAISIKTNKKNFYEAKFLVGCDGSASLVRRIFIDKDPKHFYFAKFCYAKEKMENEFQIFLDRYFSEFFAWRFPRKKYVEYGLATKTCLYEKFERFIDNFDVKIEEVYGGVIPIGYTKSYFKRGLLIGNACAQVKPLTGGGITYSLICSKLAAEELKKDKPNFKNYEKEWKNILGREIRYQLLLRKALEKMKDKKIVRVLEEVENLGVRNLEDMDFPTTKFLEKTPKLTLLKLFLKYLRYLI